MRAFLIFLLFLCLLMPSYAFPKRIISCMPSITETLFALGLTREVVGVTENCNYPPEAKLKEKVGRFTINLEKVVSLKPDMVILLEDAQRKDIKKLSDFGLPVETVNPHSVKDVRDMINILGLKTGRVISAYKLTSDMQARIYMVKIRYKDKERVPVFVIVGYKPLISVGNETFINDIIKIAGGTNIAKEAKSPYPQYNFEQLISIDPEAIVILKGVISEEDFFEDKRWEELRAVINGKILFIDPDIISRPGPRVVEAIEEIAEFLHE